MASRMWLDQLEVNVFQACPGAERPVALGVVSAAHQSSFAFFGRLISQVVEILICKQHLRITKNAVPVALPGRFPTGLTWIVD